MRSSALLLLLCVATYASAAVKWDAVEHEVRPAIGDAQATAIFRFTNHGQKAVDVVSLESSCGCTGALTDQRPYAAGETGEIAVTFTFGGRSGHQAKTITVTTRSTGEADQIQDLVISATIPDAGQVMTVSRTFLAWEIHQPIQAKEIVVRVVQPQPITVTAVEVVGTAFAVELIPVQAGREYRVRVTPASNVRTASSSLTIVTDSPLERFRRTEVVMVMSEPADSK